MTQADGSRLDPEAEADNAFEAAAEIESDGHTARRCLRCGGEFSIERQGSSYTIRCETGDYKLVSRGI